jgi:phosphopantothenoylcysteine decarboxylase/phosphopantothenate--cysteine ligase
MAGLEGKRVILGVTGSIAAFKAAALASELTQMNADVRTILTDAAQRFVTRQTFTALTGIPALSSLWDEADDPSSGHIPLASAAELIVVAPASASFIARMALGLADDLLGAVLLASPAPVIVAPAMETNMYRHPATQANLAALRARGVTIVGPEDGRLASGSEGSGRMSEPAQIISAMEIALAPETEADLAGISVVVTAGPTQEPIDPVRFISNRSSGKMGYELARAAARRGARVTLVSGPVDEAVGHCLPRSVRRVQVRTAAEMRDAVMQASSGARAVIMAAAVADFRPETSQPQKLKKTNGLRSLELEPTDDILSILQKREPDLIRIGFAAETEDLVANAQSKLERKGLAMIVANRVATDGPSVFGSDVNEVTIIRRGGVKIELPLRSKGEVADAVIDQLAELILAPTEPPE